MRPGAQTGILEYGLIAAEGNCADRSGAVIESERACGRSRPWRRVQCGGEIWRLSVDGIGKVGGQHDLSNGGLAQVRITAGSVHRDDIQPAILIEVAQNHACGKGPCAEVGAALWYGRVESSLAVAE